MEKTTPGPETMGASELPWSRMAVLTLALAALLVGGFLALQSVFPRSPSPLPLESTEIATDEFEERHGLRVHLIGVTAGGGMIDLRLKIVDGERARRFLTEPANLPRLIIAESGQALAASDGLDKDVAWDDGGILFTMLLNRSEIVKPGTTVIVQFGDLHLEPMTAQ